MTFSRHPLLFDLSTRAQVDKRRREDNHMGGLHLAYRAENV